MVRLLRQTACVEVWRRQRQLNLSRPFRLEPSQGGRPSRGHACQVLEGPEAARSATLESRCAQAPHAEDRKSVV